MGQLAFQGKQSAVLSISSHYHWSAHISVPLQGCMVWASFLVAWHLKPKHWPILGSRAPLIPFNTFFLFKVAGVDSLVCK